MQIKCHLQICVILTSRKQTLTPHIKSRYDKLHVTKKLLLFIGLIVVTITLLFSVINLKQLAFAQSDKNQTGIESEGYSLEKTYNPIAVAIKGGIATTLTVFWSNIQAHNRRQSFQRLIFRELEEVSPYPEKYEKGRKWYQYQKGSLFTRKSSKIQQRIETSFLV